MNICQVHKLDRPNYQTLQYQNKYKIISARIRYKIQGLRTDRGKGTLDLGDSRRGVEVQSEEVSLQAAVEDGQRGTSSYWDGEVIPGQRRGMRLLQWQARQSQPGKQSPLNAPYASRTSEGRVGRAVGEKKRVG